jgi:hypothetical protein
MLTLVNNINVSIDARKAALKFYWFSKISVIQLAGNEYQLIEDSEYLRAVTMNPAAAGFLPIPAAIMQFNQIVFPDEGELDCLQESTVEFIKLHEAGHCVLHKDTAVTLFRRYLIALTGNVASIEFEADEYAADRLGYDKAYYALEELEMIYHTNKVISRELRKRKEVIVNKLWNNLDVSGLIVSDHWPFWL